MKSKFSGDYERRRGEEQTADPSGDLSRGRSSDSLGSGAEASGRELRFSMAGCGNSSAG